MSSTTSTDPQKSSSSIVSNYSPLDSNYDEMLDERGEVRPHWKETVDRLNTFDAAAIERLHQKSRRQIREHGITFNVHGDAADGASRPLPFDPLPFIFDQPTWKAIDEGLKQRAHLLDEIFTDLYGERKLLGGKNGLPPELIYRHPGFLRACDGIRVPNSEHQLLLYAADIAHGVDGRPWVVNDRTQAPSGSGYALENRMVSTTVWPQLFHNYNVQRLSGFFSAVRNHFENLAEPSGTRPPRMVLLTPGPFNETYFEHAYLAAYLGFTLVQGSDLTVRDGKVFLKSLGGLQQVDLILRRVDEDFCDPLELKSSSRLGVTGLVEAARQGNVVIANPLGTGILENLGLYGFLPGLCRTILGEELKLPSAATWWCGQPNARKYVLENLEKLIIKSIYRAPNLGTRYGPELSKQELDDLRREIEATPANFVGQQELDISTVPILEGTTLQPRRAVFRGYLAAAEDGGYNIMPGGMTRTATEDARFRMSTKDGSVCKDSWIPSELDSVTSERHVTLWDQNSGRMLAPDDRELSSRAGENLFWSGRYVERSDGLARLLRRTTSVFLENILEDDEISDRHLRHLYTTVLRVVESEDEYDPEMTDEAIGKALLSLAANPDNKSSVVRNIGAFQNAAFTVRDQWSTDTWRLIEAIANERDKFVDLAPTQVTDLPAPLNNVIAEYLSFTGITLDSMTRDAGWRLLDMGRRIERSSMLTKMIDQSLGNLSPDAGIDSLMLESLLAGSDSLATHRELYSSLPTTESVLELLLLHPNYPRSLLFQLQRMGDHLSTLPRDRTLGLLSKEEKAALQLKTDLLTSDLSELAMVDPGTGMRLQLRSLMSRIHANLATVSIELANQFFTILTTPEQLRG